MKKGSNPMLFAIFFTNSEQSSDERTVRRANLLCAEQNKGETYFFRLFYFFICKIYKKNHNFSPLFLLLISFSRSLPFLCIIFPSFSSLRLLPLPPLFFYTLFSRPHPIANLHLSPFTSPSSHFSSFYTP